MTDVLERHIPSVTTSKVGKIVTGKKTRETVRLSLDVSPEFYERLGQIADKHHRSKSDVLRNAFGLFALAVQIKDEQKRLVIEDGDTRKEIVNFI
jgi:predicted transcriptional regulator